MRTSFLAIFLLIAGTVSAQLPSTGLRVHLKADAGTSTTVENQGVATWADQSGNGFNATAPGGQPVYVSNGINGQPALFFNGSQVLHIANTGALGLVNSDYEMFFVAKSGNSAIQFLASGAFEQYEVHLNGLGGLRYIPNSSYSVDHGANQAYTDGAARIFGVRTHLTAGAARVNGVDVVNFQNLRSAADAMFRLGDRSTGGYPLTGNIAEVIIYNRVLSKFERNQVETYLAGKYGLTAAVATNAPTVTLDAPEASQQQGVTFSGTVNPNGSATTYRFLYGTDEDNLTLSTEPKSIGSGSSDVAVSAAIPGLTPGQTYYVALVAENASQLAQTSPQEFTITAQPTASPTAQLPSSGLRLHLKADAGMSTTVEDAGIARWDDQSGYGNHAWMWAEAARPLYKSNRINGHPAVQFIGGRWIALPTPSSLGIQNSDYEMFFVARSASPEVQFLVGGSLAFFELHLNGASGQRFIPRYPEFIDRGTNGQFSNNTPHIFSGRASNTNSVSRVNGMETSMAVAGRATENDFLRMGIRIDATYPFLGDIAEVLFYNRTLTAQERAQVEDYLARKYGIDSDNLTLPSASIEAPTTTQDLTASFSGTVNPNGVATSVRFAYGTDPENLTQFTDAVSIGSGTADVDVSAMVTGLTRFQTYYVKLVASTDFQTVETGLMTFETKYVAVVTSSVGIVGESGQTSIRVVSDLTVPTTGAAYKIRFGSWETDFEAVETASGTFANVEQLLPNENLVFGTTYDVTIIGRGPTGQLTYGDTLSIRYVGYPSAELDSATPLQNGDVILAGRVNPNGSTTSYVIAYGTDPDELSETNAVSLGNGLTEIAITDTLSLTTGQTYWFRLISSDEDDLRSKSDLVSASTAFASAWLDSVTLSSVSDITFHGQVNPLGLETSVRFRYGTSPTNLTLATAWVSLGSGNDAENVSTIAEPLMPGSDYYVVLEADNGVNIARSDTIAFDTKFVDVRDVLLALNSEDPVQYILLSGEVDSFGASGAEYRVLFGTDPEELTEYSAYEPADNSGGAARIEKIIGGDGSLVAGITYYAVLQARSSTGRIQTSDIRSIRFAGLPVAILDSITTSQNFSARFDGKINPNGGNVTYVVQLGTDRNNLNQTGPVQPIESIGTALISEWSVIADLTPGAIYYATLAVTNGAYPTQRSDTLTFDLRYATIESFNPDVVTPTSVLSYISTYANGSAKTGYIRYGTDENNLNQTVVDPNPITGTARTSRTLNITGLTPDATYFGQWVVEDLNGGPTTYSEIIEFNTTFAVVTIDSVLTVGNLALGVRATVDTKNQDVSLRQSLRYEGGSFSDENTGITVPASTTPVSVLLPLTGLDLDEQYDLRLYANNASYNEAYSDTVSFDTYFVQYYAPSVSYSVADVAVRAELQAQPNLEYAYRVLSGTHRDTLSATGDFVTLTTSDRYTDIEVLVDGADLTSGTQYYFAIEGRGSSGWISHSDTLSLFFQSLPSARTPVVQVRSDLTSTVTATVFPNGRTVDVHVELGTSPDNFATQENTTRISGIDSVVVSLPVLYLERFDDYQLFLTLTSPDSIFYARTDTVAFDTKFPELSIYSSDTYVAVDSVGSPIYGSIVGYVEPGELETTAWVTFRREDGTVVNTTTPQTVTDVEDGVSVVRIDFGPLDPNTSYRARLVASNGIRTSVTDSLWFETTFPRIDFSSIFLQDGFASINAQINRNGTTGYYTLFYGTHPDSLNNVTDYSSYGSNNQEQFTVNFPLLNLDETKTHYGRFQITRGYDGRTYRSALFSWNFEKPVVLSSQVTHFQDLTARVDATIDTKGNDAQFWVEWYNSESGSDSIEPILVEGSDSPVEVSVTLPAEARYSTTTLALAVRAGGMSASYADTTTITFDYPEIESVAQSSPILRANNTVSVDMTFSNPGRATNVLVRYGYAPHPDSLVNTKEASYLAVSGNQLTDIPMGPIVRNDTVYYQFEVEYNGYISRSEIGSVYTLGHIITVNDIEITETANGTFTAVVNSTVDPNGIPTTIRGLLSTSTNFQGASTFGTYNLTEEDSYNIAFQGLTIGQTYYVLLDAYDNVTYNTFTQSDTLRIEFAPHPFVTNAALQANDDLSLAISGMVYPLQRELTYRIAYGTDRNALNQTTSAMAVSAESTTVALSEVITGFDRFSTVYASFVLESEEFDPIWSDTLSATMAFPTFAFGTPNRAENGDLNVPVTVDNGGFDSFVSLRYGVDTFTFTDTTEAVSVPGAEEPVALTLTIPTPGVGTDVLIQAMADTDGLVSISDTLAFTMPAPSFDLQRAFSRQDYTGVFEASVNPNGIPTQIRFEWGTNGSFTQSSPNFDLGSGFAAIDTFHTTVDELSNNTDLTARLVVFGSGFEFISDTLHFNSRVPSITIYGATAITDNSATISTQINPQGLATFVRLVYGPNGGALVDTVAVAVASTEAPVIVDLTLTGLTPVSGYDYVVMVQDQIVPEKIVTSGVNSFITPAGTPRIEFLGVTVDPNFENLVAVGRVNPMGRSVQLGVRTETSYTGISTNYLDLEEPLTGTEWIDVSIPMTQQSFKRLAQEDGDTHEQTNLSYFPIATLFTEYNDQVGLYRTYSTTLPYTYSTAVYFVTSLADTDTGVGQHGTLRYTMTQVNENVMASGGPRKVMAGDGGMEVLDGASTSDIHIMTEGTLNLTGPLPTVKNGMTLYGPGSDLFTIDAGDQFRPFTIGTDPIFRANDEPNLNFSLRNLTVANGFARGADGVDGGGGGAGLGGAVFAHYGSLYFENVVFHSNAAVGGLGSELVGTGGRGGDAPGAGTGGAGADGTGYAGNGGFGGGGGASGGPGAVRSGAGAFGGGAGANSNAVAPSGFGNPNIASSTRGADGFSFGGAVFQRSGYLSMDFVDFVENQVQANRYGQSIYVMNTEIYLNSVTFDDGFYDPDPEIGSTQFTSLFDTSPSQAPVSIETTFLTSTTARIDVERGSGTHRLIVATTSENAFDYGLSTHWFEGLRFRTSSDITDPVSEIMPGYHAVYSDTGASVTVSGLELGSTYVFHVLEYNDTNHGELYVAYNRIRRTVEHIHIEGQPSFTEVAGNALRFAGDDPITLGNATVDFSLGGHLTTALWMKPSNLDQPASLLRNGNRFTLGTTSSGAVYFVADNGTVRDSVNTDAGVLTVGTWHHIGLVSDAQRHRLYVDGLLRADVSSTADSFDFGGPGNLIAGEGFVGDLDELALYRASGTPISSIFRTMNEIITSLPTGMIASFQFNEIDSDTTVNSANSASISVGGTGRFVPAGYVQYSDLPLITDTSDFTIGNGMALQRVSEDENPVPFTALLMGQRMTTVTNAPDSLAMMTTDRVYVLQLFDTTNDLLALHVNLPGAFQSGNVLMSQFKLYHRPLRSSGAWSLVADAASFYQGEYIVFELTTGSGEYIVGRDVAIMYQQTAGTAIEFDGSGPYVWFPSNTGLNAIGSHTIQMWFKTHDATRGIQFLTSKGIEFMEIHLTGFNRSLRFIPRNGAYFDTPSNTIESNVWTHLSATFDVDGAAVKVYLNGNEVPLSSSGYNSANPYTGMYTTSHSLNIGQRTNGGYPFGGVIDELRIWNGPRTALQVFDDMRGTTPAVFQSDLVLYAQMNEGTGSIVSDAALSAMGYQSGFFDDSNWIPSTIPINENAVYSTQLTGQAGWRLLSTPVQTTVGDLLDGIWTQGFPGASVTHGTPNVYTWTTANASNSASNWAAATSASQTLQPGQGVFVYVYATDPDGNGSFPKTLNVTGQAATVAPALSARLNPNANGWALVGNPHATDIVWGDLARSGVYNVPYLWDANADEWITWNGSTGALSGGRIGAFNAFFVATMSDNPSLAAPFTARRAGENQFVGKVMEPQAAASFSLKVESPDGRSNRAWFSFDANGKLGLDEHDAFKLAPYSQQYVQLASVIQDSIRLDINHLPMLTDELSIPLRLKSTANGTYRLALNGNALPSGWDYAVIDTETGAMTRLSNAYEFTWTGAGAESARFVLKLSPNTITSTEPIAELPLDFGLDQNYPNPFNPSTVIRYTLDAGRPTSLKVYDVLGREVAVLVDGVMPAGRHSVTFDGQHLASGVYMYRLQSGNQVLTRKFTLIK